MASKLDSTGLTLSTREKPARLLRRTYLTIIGLPPAPSETAAFVANPARKNFEAVVFDLLNRPQFGERWGRHWLDLARYADSNGLHEDSDRPHAWRYRDYVIQSFNEDKPYGQFIREQIAGDEIAPKNPQALIATGFSRAGPSNEENIAANEVETYRLDQLDDIIATTSNVFLAQTIACARCHDHKTEPYSITDYYQLQDFFQNTVPAYIPYEKGKLGAVVFSPPKARKKLKLPKGTYIRALGNFDVPNQQRSTHVLSRGSPEMPQQQVVAAIPTVLATFPSKFDKTSPPRTALANWIASPENSLTWRVLANRTWQYLFGTGLVDTPANFGVSGSLPTHPELLDWIACKLRDNGGHLKPVICQIVLSDTFCQSSRWQPGDSKIDPENRLLSRFPIRRLEAEVIRDSILAASGNVNLEMGGPGIKPRIPVELLGQSKRNAWPVVTQENETHWRRSVYIYSKRQLPMPMMTLFDSPDTSQSCSVRFSSTTPTQSLTLLNDDFVNEQSRYLAKRSLHQADPAKSILEQIQCLPATQIQAKEARDFFSKQWQARKKRNEPDARKMALADLAVVLFNSSQFVYLD